MKTVRFSEHINDAHLYFRNCFGIVNQEDNNAGPSEPVIMQFRGIDGDDICMHKSTEGGGLEALTVKKSEHYRVTFPTVPNGFVNMLDRYGNNRAVYLDRIPIRQYVWGLNTQSYKARHIDEDLAARLQSTVPRMSTLSTLRSIFYPIFYTVREAMKLLTQGKAISVALGEEISLSFKWGSNHIMIFKHQSLVGKVVGETAIVYEGATYAKESLFQYFDNVIGEHEHEAIEIQRQG